VGPDLGGQLVVDLDECCGLPLGEGVELGQQLPVVATTGLGDQRLGAIERTLVHVGEGGHEVGAGQPVAALGHLVEAFLGELQLQSTVLRHVAGQRQPGRLGGLLDAVERLAGQGLLRGEGDPRGAHDGRSETGSDAEAERSGAHTARLARRGWRRRGLGGAVGDVGEQAGPHRLAVGGAERDGLERLALDHRGRDRAQAAGLAADLVRRSRTVEQRSELLDLAGVAAGYHRRT